MVNFLKNILPYFFMYLGTAFTLVNKVFETIAALFYATSVTLHMQLNTTIGKKLKDVEKATKDIMNLYASVSNKITTQKTAFETEENRLAKIIKEDKSKVVQLGDKKDDTSKN